MLISDSPPRASSVPSARAFLPRCQVSGAWGRSSVGGGGGGDTATAAAAPLAPRSGYSDGAGGPSTGRAPRGGKGKGIGEVASQQLRDHVLDCVGLFSRAAARKKQQLAATTSGGGGANKRKLLRPRLENARRWLEGMPTVGRGKLDPSLKATWFQPLNLRVHSVLST